MVFVMFAAALLTVSAADASYPNSRLLMEPADLANALPDVNDGKLLVLDARPEAEFMKARVPGAQWVNAADWARQFGKQREPETWAKLLAPYRLQTTAMPIVIYDDALMKDAARIWWILRYWGFQDVRLLNGGWRGWQTARLLTQDKAPPPPSAPAADPSLRLVPQTFRLATKQALLDRLRRENDPAHIIDARSGDEHCGKSKTAKRNGAIPGAKHLEWSDLLDKESHRFRAPNELRRLFAEAGVDLHRPIVAYCQSGGRASVMAFALELMGVKDVANYYASWTEWGNDDHTPIEPGKDPGK